MTAADFDNGLEELDSELDNFLAEIDDIEQSKLEELPEEPNLIIWRECIDETTKHPYYWHTETQEVTWIKPESYDSDLIAQESAIRQWKKKCEEIKKINEERQKAADERKKLAESQPKPSPALPRKTPRIELESDANGKKTADIPSGSFGKIGKFNFMKSEAELMLPSAAKASARLIFNVKKAPSPAREEVPPKPPSPDRASPEPTPKIAKVTVPTHTSSGRQRTVTEIAAEIKRKKQQIALTNARIHLKKRVEEQKLNKKVLEIPEKKEEIKEVKSRTKEERPKSVKSEKDATPKQENKKRRIFQENKSKSPPKEVDKDAKRVIEKESMLLKEKLEFWGGDLKKLSKFQIQIIQLYTRISDFSEGHLSASYVQGKINELGLMLRSHEENSVPKDWTCTFDREEKGYRYTNKLTGKSQLTHPGEDDASSDSDTEAGGSDKDDDLYEMFQQEIKEIETTRGESSPPKKDPSPPLPEPSKPPASPPPPVPPTPPLVPPIPSEAPPPVPPPPVPFQPPGFYQDMWGNVIEQPWGGVGHFPGMPVAPPPPPPDDGMMETYSPGNSDSEEEDEKKKDDLGVVSVKGPMRYSTPPLTPGAPTTPSEDTADSPQKAEKEEDGKKQVGDGEKSGASAKRIVKKKKKPDGLVLGAGSKKHKGMNSLVAKWNKVNKNADTALK